MTAAAHNATAAARTVDRVETGERWQYLCLLKVLVAARLRTWVVGRWMGFWWWLLEPLVMAVTYMALVTVVFHSRVPNATLFIMCALLPWAWFTTATGQAMGSLVRNARVITSVRISYAVFPCAEVLAVTIRFLFALLIIALLMLYYGVAPTRSLIWLPLLIGVQMLLTLGVSYWLALARVYVEDTDSIWRVVSRILFFLSPSIYALQQVPESLQKWYLLNPFAVLFSGYRKVIIAGAAPDAAYLVLTLIVSALLTVSGYVALRRAHGAVPLHL